MDRASVETWLNRYVEAWKSYDRQAIADLFSTDAIYRFHPYDDGGDVIHGREAIVRSWLEPDGDQSGRDEPGSYEAHYEPYAVDGDQAVAVGWSSYWTDDTRSILEQVYDNVFLIRFDGDGRCVEFTELFMKRPSPAEVLLRA